MQMKEQPRILQGGRDHVHVQHQPREQEQLLQVQVLLQREVVEAVPQDHLIVQIVKRITIMRLKVQAQVSVPTPIFKLQWQKAWSLLMRIMQQQWRQQNIKAQSMLGS